MTFGKPEVPAEDGGPVSEQAEVGKVSEAGGALLREKGRRSGVHGATPESSVSSLPNDDSPTAVMQGSLCGPIQSHGKSGLASANVPVVDQSPASVQSGAITAPAMPPDARCRRHMVVRCDECWREAAPAPPDALKLLEEWLAGGSKRGVTGIWREGCTWKVRLTNKEPSFGPTLSAAILAALEATKP